MTLSLVNISVSLNNVDCHLLFILLLFSPSRSLARSLSSSHLPSLCLNRYYIRCVYLFILPPSLPSALLFSHLDFQHLAPHRSVSSVLLLFLAPPPSQAETRGPRQSQRSHDDQDVGSVQEVWRCPPLTTDRIKAAPHKGCVRKNWASCHFWSASKCALLPDTCRKCWIPGIWHRKTVRQAIWLELLPRLREDPGSHNLCSKKQERPRLVVIYFQWEILQHSQHSHGF